MLRIRPEIPINILKIFAWIGLVLAILAGILSFCATLFTASTLNSYSSYYSGSSGLAGASAAIGGLLVALLLVLYGVLFWATLLVVATIAENLLDINDTTYWIAQVLPNMSNPSVEPNVTQSTPGTYAAPTVSEDPPPGGAFGPSY